MNPKTTKNKNKKLVVAMLDWENINRGMRTQDHSAKGFSLEAGFERIKKWLKSIGEVVWIFIYAPEHELIMNLNLFYSLGFTTVLCPKMPSETGKPKDTTDISLIRDGKRIIDHFPQLYCLCIGSGDIDFKFERLSLKDTNSKGESLVDYAKKKGIKIAVIAGNERIARGLRESADLHPITEKEMIHIFIPLEE